MDNVKNLSWTEMAPGQWERDADEIEEFYHSLYRQFAASGRHFFAIMGYVSIFVTVPSHQTLEECEIALENSLREAWKRLRFDHPTIASCVEVKGGRLRKIYEVPKPGGLASWLHDTFHVVATHMTGLDWCNADPPVPTSPTLFVLKTSESLADATAGKIVRRDLVFRSPHDVIDGMGTLMLFDNLIKHTSTAYSKDDALQPPSFGLETTQLSPCFQVAAKVPAQLPPNLAHRLEEIEAANKVLRNTLPTLSMPFNQDVHVPGKHQRISITIPVKKTKIILDSCKRRSVSVTHAYHAALAMALRDIQPRESVARTRRYINYCLVNERRHCENPYNTPAHAAAVYHSTSGLHLGIDLTIPPSNAAHGTSVDVEEFNRIVLQIKDYYVNIREDVDHVTLIPQYFAMVTPRVDLRSEVVLPIPPPNQHPSVSISSLGKVDDIIPPQRNDISVRNPWVTGEELGSGLGAFLGSYRGELHLSVAYNDAFHRKPGIEAFLKRCQEIVDIVFKTE